MYENKLLSIRILCKYLNIAYTNVLYIRKLVTVLRWAQYRLRKISNYHAILPFLIQIYIERVVYKYLLVSHDIDYCKNSDIPFRPICRQTASANFGNEQSRDLKTLISKTIDFPQFVYTHLIMRTHAWKFHC